MIKLGIFGAYRGSDFVKIAKDVGCKVTAVCDRDKKRVDDMVRPVLGDDCVYYSDFDEFIKADFDACILCNYFSEHAPFAVRAMLAGKHVLSETMSNVTMAQGVELYRTQKETGKIYMLAENYPFMRGCMRMKREYETGRFGRVLYADGEYVHPMNEEEYNLLSPGKYHWRSWLPSTYYLTHSLAPLMFMTGTMPKTVNALSVFAPEQNERKLRYAADATAAMLCGMDNGSVFRITGWATFGGGGDWYRLGCSSGSLETVRGEMNDVRIVEDNGEVNVFTTEWEKFGDLAAKTGHGGGDFWALYEFAQSIENNTEPYFNIEKALAMASVGLLGWRSCLEKGRQYDIPDFSREEDCKLYENDNLSPFPDKNGKTTLPCCIKTDYTPSEEAQRVAREYWAKQGYLYQE